MKLKLALLLISVFSVVGCSPSDETAVYEDSSKYIYEAPAPESYSVEKQSYMQSCVDTSDESFCSCQFNVMDPILSSSIGNDWSTKNMEEKDFGTYVSAVETAVSQCS